MRHSMLLAAGLIFLCGCNSQDVSTLGQIAHKVQDHVNAALGDQSDAVIKALPLLPPPGTGSKRTAAPAGGDRARTLED